ncbi:ribosome biogenesis GTP-binding protein YihA/YsxC [Eubacterium xylanophilum]|uniref:ribosome biogenesis GTP-binding protein YihA/YsxC n=1 Tax=Eubacterium xylanophilum TaxID=39497 RepID=UPI0004799B0A|nr:ribosome biogenesis GTP-binding protein YihA/YsxC [Eubacterium xylanophilum]MCR5797679.1 ribosome biogenesis GTP-binding protein YihA/YsxC [Eubacterium sp.]
MIIKSLELETVCGITSKLPKNDKIELAFWGRSNVGKSSLINTLLNRKSFARISSQPGKTQTINYYNINNACYFVDLPGYGYAKVSKEIAAKWMKMIEKYLDNSEALRVVFLLIDIRHDPSAKDVETYKLLCSKGFNPLIIATKSDKVSKNQRNASMQAIRKKLGLVEGTPIIPFSALKKEGKEEIWEYIDYFVKELKINESED